MKNFLLSVAALFSMATASFAQEQGEDSGFGLKLHAGITGAKYGSVKMEGDFMGFDLGGGSDWVEPGEGVKNKPLFGASIDNRWYVANPGNFGIGITARWLDLSIGKTTFEDDVAATGMKDVETIESKCTNVQVGMIMPGVVGTYYLGNEMAIDAFYTLGPTVGVYAVKAGDEYDDASFEFGVSHFVEAAFRYKVFQAGVEYNIARLKSQDWGNDDEEDEEDPFGIMDSFSIDTKTKRDNFRIFLGFKF